MLNGSSPLQYPAGSRDARERESLNSSIRTSFEPRIPLELESQIQPTGTGADSTEPTPVSTVSVPIRSVAPVRYEYDNIALSPGFMID
jgi:GTP cyclohydrolase I